MKFLETLMSRETTQYSFTRTAQKNCARTVSCGHNTDSGIQQK